MKLEHAHLHERETRTYESHHALVWCTNSVRRFLSDRPSDVLKHPIVMHVLCALNSERGLHNNLGRTYYPWLHITCTCNGLHITYT